MTKMMTQHTSKKHPMTELVGSPALTAGNYAHTLIGKQYHHMVQQEQGVLADDDPEYLHQMRVGSRRLSTALGTL
jgi:CHAD domain-containing protein